MPSSDAGGL
jgi:hypothetical protein